MSIVITDEGVQSFGQRNQPEPNFGQKADIPSNFGRETVGRFENFDRENRQTQSFDQRNLQESNLGPRGEMASNFGREMTTNQNFGSKIERVPEFDRRANELQVFSQGNQLNKNAVSRNEDFNRPTNLDREYIEATKMASTIEQLTNETNFGESPLPIVGQQGSKAPIEAEGNRNVITSKRPYEEPKTNQQGSWQSRLAAMDKGPASKMDSSALYSRASVGQSGMPVAEGNNRVKPQAAARQIESGNRFNTPAAIKAPNAPPGTFYSHLNSFHYVHFS